MRQGAAAEREWDREAKTCPDGMSTVARREETYLGFFAMALIPCVRFSLPLRFGIIHFPLLKYDDWGWVQ